MIAFLCNFTAYFLKRAGEHALSAVEPAAAPAGVDVLADQDAVALLKGQVTV